MTSFLCAIHNNALLFSGHDALLRLMHRMTNAWKWCLQAKVSNSNALTQINKAQKKSMHVESSVNRNIWCGNIPNENSTCYDTDLRRILWWVWADLCARLRLCCEAARRVCESCESPPACFGASRRPAHTPATPPVHATKYVLHVQFYLTFIISKSI